MMARHLNLCPVAAAPHPGHSRVHRRNCSRSRVTGFSLMAVLLMMVVLASLAFAGLNSSLLQERMAGNARDRQLAMQAAEAALRDAEKDIDTVAEKLKDASDIGAILDEAVAMAPDDALIVARADELRDEAETVTRGVCYWEYWCDYYGYCEYWYVCY